MEVPGILERNRNAYPEASPWAESRELISLGEMESTSVVGLASFGGGSKFASLAFSCPASENSAIGNDGKG
jgi:hypothetical protein